MNKHKRNAKIATSLNEVVAQTKLSGNEFSVKIIARGADGKKGTGDDKIRRKSKTKVKGDSMGEGFKVGDKVKIKTSGLTRQTERGYKRYLGKSGKIVKDYGDGDMKVNLGGNNDISINSKDLVKEESEWEEMFGDSTYQDSYWGDPATIRGKIEVARNKVKAKQDKDDEEEEQDHSDHQQRTNESNKKSYEQFIKETRGTTAVFTFGRFNPPTIGHEKLLNVVASTATKAKAESFVYTSHSQDAKKNPLSNDQKIVFMKMMFPKHRTSFMRTEAKTALHALSEIHKTGKFSKVIMVVGSDRVREFKTLLNKYNDIESKHGFYRFEDIDVISAGERDPDAEGTSGMSASKMRAAVAEGDYDVFKMGVPSGVSEKDCHTLYSAVAKGMKIKEEKIREDWEFASLWELDEDELDEKAPKAAKSSVPSKGLSPSQRRKMAIRMKIMARKPSFIMKRQRAMKRAATKAKLLMRARKSAIKMVVKKFYPKLKTKSRSELSYAERGKISQIVKKKAGLIARFAKRMVKDKRKQDVERRKSMNKPKEK